MEPVGEGVGLHQMQPAGAKHFHLALLPAQLVTLLPDVHAGTYQGADGGRAIWLLPSSFPGWSWGNCWNKGWHRLGVPGLRSL